MSEVVVCIEVCEEKGPLEDGKPNDSDIYIHWLPIFNAGK